MQYETIIILHKNCFSFTLIKGIFHVFGKKCRIGTQIKMITNVRYRLIMRRNVNFLFIVNYQVTMKAEVCELRSKSINGLLIK